jgi:predicted DNA-binding protein
VTAGPKQPTGPNGGREWHQLNVKVSPETNQELKRRAAQLSITVSDWVRDLIEKKLKEG